MSGSNILLALLLGLFLGCPGVEKVSSQTPPTSYVVDSGSKPIAHPPDIIAFLYTRLNPDEPQVISPNDTVGLLTSYFDPSRPTKVIVHGFLSSQKRGTGGSRLREALLTMMDANVLQVDWSGMSSPSYVAARLGIPRVGRRVGNLLEMLASVGGAQLSDMHIIGHSLGAHVAGLAARTAGMGGLYGRVTAPLFIFQWLFDEAQMTADNVGAPVTKEQWDFIHKMGDNFRNTFRNVSAVFAPACIAHTVLTNRDWVDVRVHDVSLPKALRCWELRTATEAGAAAAAAAADMATPLRPRIGLIGTPGGEDDDDDGAAYASPGAVPRDLDAVQGMARHRNSSLSMLSDSAAPLPLPHLPPHLLSALPAAAQPASGRRHGRRRKNRPRGKKNKKNKKGKGKGVRREGRNPGRRPQRMAGAKRRSVAMAVTPTAPPAVVPDDDCDQCEMRHVELCSWPQCNHSCPRLHNPLTGEVMDFIELLKSFGLDMTSVANALGIDIHTLNNMDHEELLNLLTQQAN